MSTEEIRRLFAAYVKRQIANPATTRSSVSAFLAYLDALDALDDIIAGRMGQLSAAELIEASRE
jgi:hypothetical protein